MLQGFVSEHDYQDVEEAFPGIWRYYAELADKPCTFLELAWRYANGTARASSAAGDGASPSAPRC